MFAKIAVIAISALAAVTGVASTPLAAKRTNHLGESWFNSEFYVSIINHSLVPQTVHSFNGWGGFSSLNGFDNFYGVDNFDGSRCVQNIIVPTHKLVCRSQAIEIIQQRLLVLQEMAKKYAHLPLFSFRN